MNKKPFILILLLILSITLVTFIKTNTLLIAGADDLIDWHKHGQVL